MIDESDPVVAFPEIVAVPETAEGQRSAGFASVQAFLERFGYLTANQYEVGELDMVTSNALARFQEFSRLKITGCFDEATREQMTRPRCALPDPVGVEFRTRCAWDRRDLTYAVDTGTGDVAADGEWAAIRSAFNTWASLGRLTFREVQANDNPDIQVGWRPARDPDLNMEGGALAHADFPPACDIVTDDLPKPVHFDDTEHTWTIGAVRGAFDVESVALHEIGHIVGLEHSNVAGAVMLPNIAANSTKRALTRDDIDGFHELYPPVAAY